MFRHESNKWSLAGTNRKVSFSHACKKEREEIQLRLDLRRCLKEKEECFLLVSHYSDVERFSDDRYSELTIAKHKNCYVVEGLKDFSMESDDIASIFKALIQCLSNHGRGVYSIIVCSKRNAAGLYDGQELWV